MSNTVEFNTKSNNTHWNFNAHKINSITGDNLQLDAASGQKIQLVAGNIEASGNIIASGNIDMSGRIISLPNQDTSSVFGKAVVGTQGGWGVFSNYSMWSNSSRWCIRQDNAGETHIQGYGNEGIRFYNTQVQSDELWTILGFGGVSDGAFRSRSQAHNIYTRKVYWKNSPSNNSDDRIKHNEVDISGLEIIRQLKPQKYQKTNLKYPADYRGDISGEWNWETGLIAQDILKINDISYCASVNNYLDIYGLTYNDIFVYGLKAIKELDIQLQEEKTKLNTVKTALNTLLTAAGQNTI